MKISCNATEVLISVGKPIDPIECSDDHSPHKTLKILDLPPGLYFDGKYITGYTSMEEFNHRTIVYYEDVYFIIVFHSMSSIYNEL